MKRYVTAYFIWFAGVMAMAVAAAAWYRYVEEIGVRELAARLNATGATEATDEIPENPES